MKTNKTQDAVLRFLYEHKDDEESPNVDAVSDGTGLDKLIVRKALQELEEKGLIKGPPSLLKEADTVLNDLGAGLKSTDSGYAEHIILAASAISKANETFLADRLGYDPEFVGIVGARLRAGGIWKDDEISPTQRALWEKGDSLSFFMAGAIAMGTLMVVGGTPENPEFQMTEDGLARAAKIMRR